MVRCIPDESGLYRQVSKSQQVRAAKATLRNRDFTLKNLPDYMVKPSNQLVRNNSARPRYRVWLLGNTIALSYQSSPKCRCQLRAGYTLPIEGAFIQVCKILKSRLLGGPTCAIRCRKYSAWSAQAEVRDCPIQIPDDLLYSLSFSLTFSTV